MLSYCCLTLIFTLCLTYKVNAEFPEDPKPCKYGDSECLLKTINYLFHEKSQGENSLNLASLDPIQVEKVQIKQGAGSPVNIDLVLLHSSIYGLSATEVLKVSGFGKNMTQKHEVVLKTKSIQSIGRYTIDGQILILPIKGSGTGNITIVNGKTTLKFKGTPVEKDDGIYMKIDKLNYSLEPERMIFKIDNLFNGDKALGDNMNLFLNENWADIYKEIRPSFQSAYGAVFKNIINQVFSKYPYEKYFIE